MHLNSLLNATESSVSREMLANAMRKLFPKSIDVYSEETTISLEWRLKIILAILEQICQKGYRLGHQFRNDMKTAISIYKRNNSKITKIDQEGVGQLWKPELAEIYAQDNSNEVFKCNYDNKYLLEVIKNTLNSLQDDRDQQQTNMSRVISVLKAFLASVPGLVKIGIKATIGVEVPVGDFDLERSWKYLVEAFPVEPSGKPWYTTWRQLIILQHGLDKPCQQKEPGISTVFKERLLLEYFWYHISLCYADDAANNQNVSDTLWFGILDIIQQLIQKTFSMTTQAICYYIALDSLENATSEYIQFKAIEVLLSLEAKNNQLFVTTPDDIANCDEEHIPRLVEIYHYLKAKLAVESKMLLKYSLNMQETRSTDEKGKGKKCDDRGLKLPIDYIAEARMSILQRRD